MVSVCSDGTMWQMNVKSGKQHPVFQAHAKNINDVKFSTDGSVFATVSDDGTLVRHANTHTHTHTQKQTKINPSHSRF